MKARLCLAASLLLMAAPAFAQEPVDKAGSEPSTAGQAAPAPTPDPLDKTATEPSTNNNQAAPAAMPEPLDKTATEPSTNENQAAPAEKPEPLDKVGTEQPSPPANQPAPQAKADAPAEVVVSELTEAQDKKKLVKPWNVPVDTVEQMDVYDANGKKLGQIDAVLQDKNGDVRGVAVGYGGFLGFGEKGAIMTLDQLKLKDGTLITDVNEDQLSKLPEWLKK
jgi:sporulation protein YlmC with PRC-barrel domain